MMTSCKYGIDVDRVTEAQWTETLSSFRDANLYQTWAYAAVRWGSQRTSRLTVTRHGQVVALAQVVVAQPLGIRMGVAQLRWGPVWEPRRAPFEPKVASLIVDALHEEYVHRRKLHLRVLPSGASSTDGAAVIQAALARRFSMRAFDHGESFRTVLVNLEPELDAIRRGLDQKWRNQLNRAERNGLIVKSGDTAEIFLKFSMLYEQMVARKGLAAQDIDTFRRVQALLPNGQKMKIFMCEEGNQPVAGVVVTAVGDTGVYVLGATNELGMKCKGAYLLQWCVIEYLRQQGLHRYDLGGINPQSNPGVYHFKKGLGGQEADYIPPYESCSSTLSKLAARSLRFVRSLGTRPGAAQRDPANG
jgi:FemAB family